VIHGKGDILSAKEGLEAQGKEARDASRRLARLSGKAKDQALENIADRLKSEEEQVLSANEKDCHDGRLNGLSEASLDRLRLDPERLAGIARDVRRVAAMPDPVAESFDDRVLSNGLRVGKRRVPLGVIGAIYESRPNVTIDIAALCLKAGNAVILRGGSEAFYSNSALSGLVRRAISEACLPEEAVQFVESTDRTLVGHMLAMKEYIDLVIPRGSAELVRRVASEAAMPAITGGIGVCHTYVDRSASVDIAVEIVDNAKVSRPSVCNALDTVLVHVAVAPAFLPRLADRWAEAGVEMRCDRRALSILGRSDGHTAVSAGEGDWGQEFLSLVASVKVVDTMDEALAHVDTYGSGHTDAIVTEDYSAAGRFLDEVDSAVVMVNASTRFNDGAELGLGAEVAISTNKLHARGPMGLRELTSYKWTVLGAGQVRP